MTYTSNAGNRRKEKVNIMVKQPEVTRVIRERRPKSPMVTLTVTPEIIEKAKPSDSGHCPIHRSR
jgi:hypothetical protein